MRRFYLVSLLYGVTQSTDSNAKGRQDLSSDLAANRTGNGAVRAESGLPLTLLVCNSFPFLISCYLTFIKLQQHVNRGSYTVPV